MHSLSFKRPLAAMGIPFLAGAFLGTQTLIPWYILLAVGAAGTMCLLFLRKKRTAFFLIFALLGVLCTGAYRISRPIDGAALNGQTVIVRGTVADTRTYQSGSRFVLENATVNGSEPRATVLISLYSESGIADGDTVELRAVCRSDPNAFFDADRYYYERGIDLSATGDTILLHEKAASRPLSHLFSQWRNALSETTLATFSHENAVFLQGLMLGADDGLSLEAIDDLNRSGARHLFVVSGLHVTLAVGSLYGFCRRIKLPPWLCALIALLADAGIVLLTGCTLPVIRAGIMTAVIYIGRLFYLRADSANSLFGTAMVMVFFSPYIITSASFLLTFSASAGVYILAPFFVKTMAGKSRRFRWNSAFGRSLATVFAGTVAVFPVSAVMLGGVSLLSPLTNLLSSLFLQPLLIGGVLAVCGIPFLSEAAGYLCEIMLSILRAVFSSLASVPFSYMGTRDVYFTLWLILAAALLFIRLLLREHPRKMLQQVAALLLLLPVCMGVVKLCAQPALIATAASTTSAELVLLEKDGNADLIVIERRANWGQNALSLLRSRNVSSLRSLILLTEDSVSSSAPELLAARFSAKTVLLYEENTLADHTDTLLPDPTETVLLAEDHRRVLYPGLDIRRDGGSVTVKVSNGGRSLVLSDRVPEDAAAWLLFSENLEELHLRDTQAVVLLSVPDELEISGGRIVSAETAAVTVCLPQSGNLGIWK